MVCDKLTVLMHDYLTLAEDVATLAAVFQCYVPHKTAY